MPDPIPRLDAFNEWDNLTKEALELQDEAARVVRAFMLKTRSNGYPYSLGAYILHGIVGIMESELRMDENLIKREVLRKSQIPPTEG